MGTGVGEAMLIGAAVGGGSSALTGGDPLKGAMMGAAGGALGGAFATPGFDPTALAGATELGSVAGTSSLNAALDPSLASFGTMSPQAISQGVSSGTIPLEAANQYGQSFSQAFEGIKPISPNFANFSPLTNTQLGLIGGGAALSGLMESERKGLGVPGQEGYVSSFDPTKFRRSEPTYAPGSVYVPEYKSYAAEGGIMKAYQSGGPVERMSQMNTAMNPQGGLYPMGMIDKTQYATPIQRPVSSEMVMDAPAYERSNPMLMAGGGIAGILESARAQGYTPMEYDQIYGRGNALQDMQAAMKRAKYASGGISSLGGYSDGGRMLKGPGDGMSDSIPGVIAGKQPARLADGEFVVPADVVSHLGNGSTDAGAKRLYSMMDKVRKARTGTKKQGKQINPNRFVPA
jgi:hypothetical protein